MTDMTDNHIAPIAAITAPLLQGATSKNFRNDTANAQLFVKLCGRDYKYCKGRGWLKWMGTRWSGVDEAEVILAASVVGDYLEAQAANVQGSAEQKDLRRWANQSRNEAKLASMVKLARPQLTIDPSQLDSHDHLLNLENGTYDAKTGKLRDHDPEDLLTMQAAVSYDPTATCPEWLRFQEEVANGDTELVRHKQKAFSYALFGGTEMQKFFILHGGGSNGKSTEMRVMGAILGDYADETSFDTFLDTHNDLPALSSLARMQGKRFVSASEPRDGRRLNESRIKALTGGEAIEAKVYHRDTVAYRPKAKVFLSTNTLPEIHGTDEGIWRRTHVIPYDRSFSGAECDPYLLEKLLAEGSGILNCLLEGYRLYLVEGLGTCDVVERAKQTYRYGENVVQQFIDEACEVDASFEEGASTLYKAFEQWCSRTNNRKLSIKSFGEDLKRLGFQVRKGSNNNYRMGLKLKASNA